MNIRYLLPLLLFPAVSEAGFGNAQPSYGAGIDWEYGYVDRTAQWVPSKVVPNPTNPSPMSVKNGGIVIDVPAKIVPAKGVSLPVVARSAITNPAAASVIKKAARTVGAAGGGPLGLMLMTIAVDMGFEILFNQPAGQDPTVNRVQNDYVCPAGSWGNETYPPYWQDPDVKRTKYCVPMSATSSLFRAGYSITSSKYGWNGVTFPCGNASCLTGTLDYGTASNVPGQKNTKAIPSSLDELANEIAKPRVWPDDSIIPELLEESHKATGEPIPVEKPSSVTGPSSASGPTESTQTPITNGTRQTTTTTKYDCTYGPSVTCTRTSTTVSTDTVTNPETGEQTTTTTKPTVTETAPEQVEQPKPEEAPTDTPLPDKPKLYERKYPDGLEGVWRDRKEQMTSSSLLQLAKAMSPTISGSGGCPQFVIPAQIGPLSFGTGYQGPPCWIWDFCKAVVLLSAAFLARALIFGG